MNDSDQNPKVPTASSHPDSSAASQTIAAQQTSTANSTAVRPKKTSALGIVLGVSVVLFLLFITLSSALWFGLRMIRGGGGSGKDSAVSGKISAMLHTKSGVSEDSAGVGVLEINGVILDSKRYLKRLQELEDDEEIDAVVIRLNSPGGAVGPSQEVFDAVRAFPKPIVASMGSVAASGAFYIACGTKKVFANPGTLTGSIGVIMEFANLGKLYEWAKIQRYSVTTGKFKDAGADYRAMSAEERKYFQDLVDDVLVQFKEAVLLGRGLKPEELNPLADGRVFSGAQAKKYKLVDELGGLKEAAQAAGILAGKKGEPEVIWPRSKGPRFLEFILDQSETEDEISSSTGEPRSVLESWIRALIGNAVPELKSGHSLEAGLYWIWPGARK